MRYACESRLLATGDFFPNSPSETTHDEVDLSATFFHSLSGLYDDFPGEREGGREIIIIDYVDRL